jgi:hypothetical protein
MRDQPHERPENTEFQLMGSNGSAWAYAMHVACVTPRGYALVPPLRYLLKLI